MSWSRLIDERTGLGTIEEWGAPSHQEWCLDLRDRATGSGGASEDIECAMAIRELKPMLRQFMTMTLDMLARHLGYKPEWGHLSSEALCVQRELGMCWRTPADEIWLPPMETPRMEFPLSLCALPGDSVIFRYHGENVSDEAPRPDAESV